MPAVSYGEAFDLNRSLRAKNLGACILSGDLDIAEVVGAWVTDTHVLVALSDGREIATPLAWYPTLERAAPALRKNLEVSPFGVHWPDLNEDLSVEGMLKGLLATSR